MHLIVGGAYQGKRAFACAQYGIRENELADGKTCELGTLATAKGMSCLQEYIKRMLLEDQDAMELIKKEVEQNPKVILLCNEMGCGLVPIHPFDRKYRDMVGRIQCELAKQAETVERVTCGIGVRIK